MVKVLVIDDSQDMRRLVAQILSNAGYQVLEASGGQEGLRLFRAHRPPVVVSDILMPDMDGLETFRQLRREAPEIGIIAISGADQTIVRAVTKLWANIVLAKPFRPAELVAAVRSLVAS
jgi:DNA-binding response OmpR family regulator